MEKYETLERELIEILSKSFTYKDLDQLGKDIFGRKYDTHKLEGMSQTISISPTNAARRLIYECIEKNKLETLLVTLVQLDGNYLNDKIVRVRNLDNLLYHQSQYGVIYDYRRRKFIQVKTDPSLIPNWGVLRENKKYILTVASLDIVKNSQLVKKNGSSTMEKVYKRLLDFIRAIMASYDGRIWSWQGDGGLIAFPNNQAPNLSIACCMNILLALPIFNLHPDRKITDDISLRVGADRGEIAFLSDTGKIVSKTINYASHLEKSYAEPSGIAISGTIYQELDPKIQKIFSHKEKFEEENAYKAIPMNHFASKGSASASATKKKK